MPDRVDVTLGCPSNCVATHHGVPATWCFALIITPPEHRRSFSVLLAQTMAHSATAQDDAIKEALKDVTGAADQYYKLSAQSAGQSGVLRDGVNSAGDLTVLHNQLFVKAMQLVRAIRGPVDMLFAHFENVSCITMNSIEPRFPLFSMSSKRSVCLSVWSPWEEGLVPFV